MSNRVHVVLTERDGRVTLFHGLVVAPAGVDATHAKEMIDAALSVVKKIYGDEWNYTDVLECLKGDDFEVVGEVSVWQE